jgi:hypothetical protein
MPYIGNLGFGSELAIVAQLTIITFLKGVSVLRTCKRALKCAIFSAGTQVILEMVYFSW